MDNIYRLKIKVGQHEFEAEGPAEIVQDQFAAFKDLVAAAPATHLMNPQFPGVQEPLPQGFAGSKPDTPSIDTALPRIMKTEGRTISLTVRPSSAEDAVLLLLYGQKVMRENDAVTGAEVMDGITATGGLAVLRVDRLLEKLARLGDVIVIGEHRAKRYRLINAGIAKGRQIAVDMIALVA